MAIKAWLAATCLTVISASAWSAQVIQPEVLNALQQAQAQQQQGQTAAAKQLLERLQLKAKSAEQALVWRSLAYLSWSEQDYAATLDYLQQALQSGQLTAAQASEDRQNFVELALAQGRYQAALAQLALLPVTPQRQLLEIQALQALGKTQAVRQLAQQLSAENLALDSLQSLLAAALKQEDYTVAAIWQRQLLLQAPENTAHWRQLAVIQQRAEDWLGAFSTLHAAYLKQLPLTAEDWQRMVELAQVSGQPWQAARLLQELLARQQVPSTQASQTQLARLYWQAKERELALRLFRELAETYQQAEDWLAVAQLALQVDQLELGQQALVKAKQQGAEAAAIAQLERWLKPQVTP